MPESAEGGVREKRAGSGTFRPARCNNRELVRCENRAKECGEECGEKRDKERGENRAENQATVRPVFIFAATSTEIRHPIARYAATGCQEPPAKLTSATAMNGVKPPPTTLAT